MADNTRELQKEKSGIEYIMQYAKCVLHKRFGTNLHVSVLYLRKQIGV